MNYIAADHAKIRRAIGRLTLRELVEYATQTDRLLWIEYSILDFLDIPKSYAEYTEEQIDKVLARITEELATC